MKRLSSICFLFLLLAASACSDDPKPQPDPIVPHDSVAVENGDTVVYRIDSSGTPVVQVPVADCSILRRRVTKEPSGQRLLRDLRLMSNCGLDSFDFVYVVPNLALEYIELEHYSGNDSLTYGDVLRHVNEFKATAAYTELHQQVMALDSLRSIRFEKKDLERMKPVVGRLGFTEPDWLAFSKFASTYPLPKDRPMTWGDLLEAFDGYMAKQKN